MPLQIKEVHINLTVNTNQNQSASEQGNAVSGSVNSPSANKGDLIAECVEQVMEILKEKMEP